jgi:hypothetical protein
MFSFEASNHVIEIVLKKETKNQMPMKHQKIMLNFFKKFNSNYLIIKNLKL